LKENIFCKKIEGNLELCVSHATAKEKHLQFHIHTYLSDLRGNGAKKEIHLFSPAEKML
jgi:hypothetical protein